MSEHETLRDTFAAAALTGILAGRQDRVEESHADVWAHMAGTLADAMLRERAATNHDAAPAAKAAELARSPGQSPRGTGGTTREPVAWGVLPGDGLPLWRCSSRGQAQAVCIWLREQRPGTDPHVVPLVDGRDPAPPALTDAEREAIAWAARETLYYDSEDHPEVVAHGSTLRAILARHGGDA